MSEQNDTISRQDAIKAMGKAEWAKERLRELPPAQSQRDIPKKPNEAVDRTWGISARQAVCPNCDAYLGVVYFFNESDKKITYCESCGQAIDWTDWEDK